jgi:hypothetical protein
LTINNNQYIFNPRGDTTMNQTAKRKISLTLTEGTIALLEEICLLDRRNKTREITQLIELYGMLSHIDRRAAEDQLVRIKVARLKAAKAAGMGAPVPEMRDTGVKAQIIPFPGGA